MKEGPVNPLTPNMKEQFLLSCPHTYESTRYPEKSKSVFSLVEVIPLS